jgi:hypothetical protein
LVVSARADLNARIRYHGSHRVGKVMQRRSYVARHVVGAMTGRVMERRPHDRSRNVVHVDKIVLLVTALIDLDWQARHGSRWHWTIMPS